MRSLSYMTGAELENADHVTPIDVIESLRSYVIEGGDILPRIYDEAVGRCEPPMSDEELKEVIELCTYGIAKAHMPKTPIDYSRPGHHKLSANAAQANFAGLLGATSLRLN